eukprot:11194301-Lingulodinium_polyedra.AAC.1
MAIDEAKKRNILRIQTSASPKHMENGHVRRRRCPSFGLNVSKTQEKRCHHARMRATVITFCIPR